MDVHKEKKTITDIDRRDSGAFAQKRLTKMCSISRRRRNGDRRYQDRMNYIAGYLFCGNRRRAVSAASASGSNNNCSSVNIITITAYIPVTRIPIFRVINVIITFITRSIKYVADVTGTTEFSKSFRD